MCTPMSHGTSDLQKSSNDMPIHPMATPKSSWIPVFSPSLSVFPSCLSLDIPSAKSIKDKSNVQKGYIGVDNRRLVRVDAGEL